MGHRLFGPCTTLLIVLNTVVMMFNRNPIDPATLVLLETANDAFTLAFTVEMLLQHAALGCAQYWADGFHGFDGMIVLVSVLDVISSYGWLDMGLNPSFLRALRLLRLFRLFRAWLSLQRLLTVLGEVAGRSLVWLLLLLFLVLFIFALLGMQIFSGQFTPAAGFADANCAVNPW